MSSKVCAKENFGDEPAAAGEGERGTGGDIAAEHLPSLDRILQRQFFHRTDPSLHRDGVLRLRRSLHLPAKSTQES